MIHTRSHTSPASVSMQGVTLLVAVILSSVILSVAMALLDIAYKQQLLASTTKQSQYAFYNADNAMECALYWDQKVDAFDYTPLVPAPNVMCNTMPVIHSITNIVSGGGGMLRKTTFDITCSGSDVRGSITVYKSDGTGTCGTGSSHTCVYVTGYSSCESTDPRRIERGLKVLY